MVATLDNGRAQTTIYGYDGVGNRATLQNPNGTLVEYQYDVRNRLKSVRSAHLAALVHKASTAASAAILLSLSYSVDASGLRTQVAETRRGTPATITRTTDYQYDAVKRLTREAVAGSNAQTRTTARTYDKVGNRKTESSTGTVSRNQTYTYDANDRLLSETGSQPFTYSYDAAGNLLDKKQGTTIVAAYEWDSENRLIRATLGNGATQKITSYSDDPNGIRRAQELQDASVHTRTEYLIDPNQAYAQVLEDWEANAAAGNPTGSEALSNTYVHGDDLISQTLLTNNVASATSVYHYDGLGTTRALSAYNVDAAGNSVTTGPTAHGAVTDRYAYTAFGESDPAGSSGNTSGTTENNYRYTGEQLDPNLGFYYLRARYMDPRSGRFLGMDGWGGDLKGRITQNKFVYGHQSPIMTTDPSGNVGLIDLMTGIEIQSMGRVVSGHTLRRYMKRLITQVIRDVGSVRREVRKCLRSIASCDIDVPILVVGGTHPDIADHILAAQTASGSNYLPSGFLHSFNSRVHTPWYIGHDACRPSDLVRAVVNYGPSVDCDEFPMNSMDLGGSTNYPLFVSLRYVPLAQNRSIGRMWLQLVNASGMRAHPNKKALVIAWREIPISVWIPNN